jgi:hypothetical protein
LSDDGITRRAALALLGSGAAAVLVGGAAARELLEYDSSNTSGPPRDPLPDAAARLDGIARVGARYRELVTDEADRAALLAAIPMAEELADEPSALEDEIGARREQIRSDFATGDVVQVDGWRLSRTEARLAALVSLEGG